VTEQRSFADPPGLLLGTARELTRRVRRAQRATWFPLVLLGAVVIAAAPVYRLGAHPHVTDCAATALPGGGLAERCFASYGWPAFVYWMITLPLAYAAIAGFYVLRARRRGVGTRIVPYVAAGLAGLAVVAACWPLQRDLESGYPVALVVHGLNPLFAIGMALFVLAWVERNWALLAFAAGYLVTALLPDLYNVSGLLAGQGWVVARQWLFLPGLWLAGGLLLLGGAAFAAAERRRA
jgi:hypothetical protein